MEIKFYDDADDALLKFAVIVARHRGKWVFCRHRQRTTYEVPGGHREPGESVDEAAKRELYEETGALCFDLVRMGVYSLTGASRLNPKGDEWFGMSYFAEIHTLGPLPPSEIAEVILLEEPPCPDEFTYPDSHPVLLERARLMNLGR